MGRANQKKTKAGRMVGEGKRIGSVLAQEELNLRLKRDKLE